MRLTLYWLGLGLGLFAFEGERDTSGPEIKVVPEVIIAARGEAQGGIRALILRRS